MILRPFKLSDAKQVQRLAGDKRVASTTKTVPYPYPDGVAEAWINTHELAFLESKNAVFAITLKSGELIGAISLDKIIDGHQAEMSYWVGLPFWNNGYCTEAGEAVLQYGFSERWLNRVYACYLARNPASGRVLEKLGMIYEGTLRQHILKWGGYEDLAWMGILRFEWENTTEK